MKRRVMPAGILILGLLGLGGAAASCALGDYKPPPPSNTTGSGGAAGSGGSASSGGGSVSASTGGTNMTCTADADCPKGEDSLCTEGRCVNGSCTVVLLSDPDGTDRKPNAVGDCFKHACVNGALTNILHEKDYPDDGNVCTDDYCDNNGTPINAPHAEGSDCGIANFCAYSQQSDAISCGMCVPSTGTGCPGEVPCVEGMCYGGLTCKNGVKDAVESDVDCGGGGCPPCEVGGHCNLNEQCVTLSCVGTQCAEPTCTDGRKNGTETGVDCGGKTCGPCGLAGGCAVDDDCKQHVCYGGSCQGPRCDDNVMNGQETGLDCGGNCDPCAP